MKGPGTIRGVKIGMNKKMIKLLFWGSLVFTLIILFFPFKVLAGDPWDSGQNRNMAKNLGGWAYPTVVVSGTTCVEIDITKSRVIRLDLDAATAGVSFFFKGTADVPAQCLVIWNGTGYGIQPSNTGGTGGENSPFVYGAQQANDWPFPPITSNAAYTYALSVVTGMWGPGEVSGSTVYGISGVTLFD